MTKYRIKNPEIEKAVRGLFKTQKGFESSLQKIEHRPNKTWLLIPIPSWTCSVGTFEIIFEENDIEEVVEYDPNAWNEYPKVKPPKIGLYRVELVYVDRHLNHYLGLPWNGEEWSFTLVCAPSDYDYIRFKPWDDEE